jgi:hypothetical protein
MGLFQKFESIPDSTDKYILIKEYNTNKIYRVRTIWDAKNTKPTYTIKEDLSQIGEKTVGRGYLQGLGDINEVTSRFTEGKVIIALLKSIKVEGIDIGPSKDENNNYEATWIIFR